MTAPAMQIPPPSARVELAVTVLVSWAVFASIPLWLGGIGLGWDALNHHVYLGWVADSPRFDRDFLAAHYQSYQYPYLYWPMYKMVQAGLDGALAGALLASLNVLVVPALWLVSRVLVPARDWEGTILRATALALAFASGVVLSHFDSTGNDLLAAIPLVWAVALALAAWLPGEAPRLKPRTLMILSGACAGMAAAFKLSNGPLALVLPVAWACVGKGWRARITHAVSGSVATVAAFAVFYAYWGWQLWLHFGNPVYPFYEGWFALLRRWIGVAS